MVINFPFKTSSCLVIHFKVSFRLTNKKHNIGSRLVVYPLVQFSYGNSFSKVQLCWHLEKYWYLYIEIIFLCVMMKFYNLSEVLPYVIWSVMWEGRIHHFVTWKSVTYCWIRELSDTIWAILWECETFSCRYVRTHNFSLFWLCEKP